MTDLQAKSDAWLVTQARLSGLVRVVIDGDVWWVRPDVAAQLAVDKSAVPAVD